MKKGISKRQEKLGMSCGKANNILRKSIMFYLVQQLNLDICYRCGTKIETIGEFTIEHKVDWLNSEKPVELFFNLENISFSHYTCNVKSGQKVPRKSTYTKEELRKRNSDREKTYRHTDEYRNKNKLYMRTRYADPVFWERHKKDSKKSYQKKNNNLV